MMCVIEKPIEYNDFDSEHSYQVNCLALQNALCFFFFLFSNYHGKLKCCKFSIQTNIIQTMYTHIVCYFC